MSDPDCHSDNRPDAHRALEIILLGGPADRTAEALWGESGIDAEFGKALWRAMGFPIPPDDAALFGPSDAEALRRAGRRVTDLGLETDGILRMTRMMGQAISRVADALAITMVAEARQLGPNMDPHDATVAVVEQLTALSEEGLVYMFRRHLLAALSRDVDLGKDEARRLVVGFADVVNFTRLSGQLDEADLGELLEQFESITSDEVVHHGGAVVKLIGDAVLFTIDEPSDAAELALHLAERFGGEMPEVRVGLAVGDVIRRQGDVFGPVVNLASRLVGYARPGTVLASEELADGLDERFDTRAVRARDLKGFGRTDLAVIRWADQADLNA